MPSLRLPRKAQTELVVMPMFGPTFHRPIGVTLRQQQMLLRHRRLRPLRRVQHSFLQKRLAALVDRDRLEMTESITHEIDPEHFPLEVLLALRQKGSRRTYRIAPKVNPLIFRHSPTSSRR